MKTNISGVMFSYIHSSGQERLEVRTFGVSKTKAKRCLQRLNHTLPPEQRITPVALYSVNIVVNGAV